MVLIKILVFTTLMFPYIVPISVGEPAAGLRRGSRHQLRCYRQDIYVRPHFAGHTPIEWYI